MLVLFVSSMKFALLTVYADIRTMSSDKGDCAAIYNTQINQRRLRMLKIASVNWNINYFYSIFTSSYMPKPQSC